MSSARLPPRGSNLPGNIPDCLHLLTEIVSKYNDADPDDPPQENDYLQAMDLLKRINDIRPSGFGIPAAGGGAAANASPAIPQIVIQWRQRATFHHQQPAIDLADDLAMSLAGYVNCPKCGRMLKDRYALQRHQKRAACLRASVLVAANGNTQFQRFLARVNLKIMSDERGQRQMEFSRFPERACVRISIGFVAAMAQIHKEAQMVVRRPKSDYSIPLLHNRPYPMRLLPQMLWDSLWNPSSYFWDAAFVCPKDDRRVLMYHPGMFVGKMKTPPNIFRVSLCQAFTNLMLPFVRTFTQGDLIGMRNGNPWEDDGYAYRVLRMYIGPRPKYIQPEVDEAEAEDGSGSGSGSD